MKASAHSDKLSRTTPSRRTVLKAAGTVGLLSALGVSGTAVARSDNYGNGNGVGAFLNDEAAFKKPPVWDSGVADMTGQNTVDVTVGAMTTVHPPGSDPEQAPLAFDPVAVKVSPDTDVVWNWAVGHHSVTSYNADASSPGDHGQLYDEHSGPFTYTFEDVGNYLYFCIPHGTPYPLDFGPPIGEVENLVGMRGAVIVSDE
jgi:plastocyanin